MYSSKLILPFTYSHLNIFQLEGFMHNIDSTTELLFIIYVFFSLSRPLLLTMTVYFNAGYLSLRVLIAWVNLAQVFL